MVGVKIGSKFFPTKYPSAVEIGAGNRPVLMSVYGSFETEVARACLGPNVKVPHDTVVAANKTTTVILNLGPSVPDIVITVLAYSFELPQGNCAPYCPLLSYAYLVIEIKPTPFPWDENGGSGN